MAGRPQRVSTIGAGRDAATTRAARVQAGLSAVPASRLSALARYGLTAKAPLLRELADPRRDAAGSGPGHGGGGGRCALDLCEESPLRGSAALPGRLYSAAELVGRAADLLSDSAGLVHDNERRWRIFRARVDEIVNQDGPGPSSG